MDDTNTTFYFKYVPIFRDYPIISLPHRRVMKKKMMSAVSRQRIRYLNDLLTYRGRYLDY